MVGQQTDLKTDTQGDYSRTSRTVVIHVINDDYKFLLFTSRLTP